MKNVILAAALIAAIAAAAYNKPPNNSNSITTYADSFQMKQYWLVLLKKGANRNHSEEAADKIQAAHMANITRLHQQGKIILAGPMGNDQDIRGIFIMDGKDSLDIVKQVSTDSAVITGRLRFEVHPWWTAKGKYKFK